MRRDATWRTTRLQALPICRAVAPQHVREARAVSLDVVDHIGLQGSHTRAAVLLQGMKKQFLKRRVSATPQQCSCSDLN